MTKETFKQYIVEAIDSMQESDLEYLFPNMNQPDLYTLAEELTGLKGEVKKLAGSSLRLNQDIRSLLDLTQAANEEAAANERTPEDLERENKELRDNLKFLLRELIEQDDFITRTAQHLETLPSPGLLSLSNFKTSMAAWEKGFEITVNKWQTFIKSLGLFKTGLPGEPFDPALHEAVAVKNDSKYPENHIIESEVSGFLYQQTVIRQAKVVVSKRPPQPAVIAVAPAESSSSPAAPTAPGPTSEALMQKALSLEEMKRRKEKRKLKKSKKNKRKNK